LAQNTVTGGIMAIDYFGPLNAALADTREQSNLNLAQAYKLKEFEEEQKLSEVAARIREYALSKLMRADEAANKKEELYTQAGQRYSEVAADPYKRTTVVGDPTLQLHPGLQQMLNPGEFSMQDSPSPLVQAYGRGDVSTTSEKLNPLTESMGVFTKAGDPLMGLEYAGKVKAGMDALRPSPKDIKMIKPGEQGKVYNEQTGQWDTVFDNPKEMPEGKGFDTIDMGNATRVIPRDGSAPYTVPKSASPNTIVKIEAQRTSGGGNGEKPLKLKTLPASTISDLSDAQTLLQAMDTIGSPKTNTGPIAGRTRAVLNKFGMASSDFTDLTSKLAGVNNIMLKLRSGAAVTDPEYERFKNEMPTVNDDEKVFTTKLANAKNYALSVINNKVQNFEEGGYKVPENVKRTAAGQPSPIVSTGPKVGEVQDGYKFKGGNPSDPKSWFKVGR
jgi:hypothetical protein